MVFDVTPHGSQVEIDMPEHCADLIQCPQFRHHVAGAVAHHQVR